MKNPNAATHGLPEGLDAAHSHKKFRYIELNMESFREEMGRYPILMQ
jgi:hypothetical protein